MAVGGASLAAAASRRGWPVNSRDTVRELALRLECLSRVDVESSPLRGQCQALGRVGAARVRIFIPQRRPPTAQAKGALPAGGSTTVATDAAFRMTRRLLRAGRLFDPPAPPQGPVITGSLFDMVRGAVAHDGEGSLGFAGFLGFLALAATNPQPIDCVTLSVTLVGVSNTVQIVRPPDRKWLYSAVRHDPTA